MARGGRGLTEVSLGPAMPYPSTACRWPAAVSYPTLYAFGFEDEEWREIVQKMVQNRPVWQWVSMDFPEISTRPGMSAMPNSSKPCGWATPKTALQLFWAWPARREGILRPSSTPLDTPHRTGLVQGGEKETWETFLKSRK
jgi:hypothetical protein